MPMLQPGLMISFLERKQRITNFVQTAERLHLTSCSIRMFSCDRRYFDFSLVRACSTPFLDIELGGNQQSVMLAAVLTPRLAPLRHKWYMTKYYKTVPDSEAGDNSIPFSELYKRMLSRAESGVYTHFHSPAVYTRMMQGHGAFFTFNPSNPEALRAVTEDLRALVTLWCAWVGADFQDDSTILTEKEHIQECCDMSRNMARFLEFDDDAAAARKAMSEDDFKKLLYTLSGEATLGGEPLWM